MDSNGCHFRGFLYDLVSCYWLGRKVVILLPLSVSLPLRLSSINIRKVFFFFFYLFIFFLFFSSLGLIRLIRWPHSKLTHRPMASSRSNQVIIDAMRSIGDLLRVASVVDGVRIGWLSATYPGWATFTSFASSQAFLHGLLALFTW